MSWRAERSSIWVVERYVLLTTKTLWLKPLLLDHEGLESALQNSKQICYQLSVNLTWTCILHTLSLSHTAQRTAVFASRQLLKHGVPVLRIIELDL